MRRRLDTEIVRRGMLPSRHRAAAAVEEGQVLVSGVIADKPSRLVAPGEPIEFRQRPRFVSRAGVKLEAALERFGVDVTGRRCLDAGASTGGFTDCLLQRGAVEVVAVDVGHGQLDQGLRRDPRVRVLEGVNIRHVTVADVGGPVEVITADLAFISLRLVAAPLRSVAAEGGDAVVLVKPQFEAGRDEVGRGGIVRDAAIHRRVLSDTVEALETSGFGARSAMSSPIRGASGNVEFLVHVVAGEQSSIAQRDLDRAVSEAHGDPR